MQIMAQQQAKITLSTILFWLLMAVLPVFRVEALLDPSHLSRYLVLGFLGLLLLAFSFKSWQQQKFPLPISVAFLVFAIFQIISITVAQNQGEAYGALARYLSFIPFFFMLINELKSGRISKSQLLSGGLLFAAASAIPALFQILSAFASGAFFEDVYTITGLYGHKNLLASALMLAFPLSIAAWASLGSWQKSIAAIVSLIIIFEIFVLRTRGVWLSFSMAAILTLVMMNYYSQGKIKVARKWLFINAGLAVVILAALFFNPAVKESFLNSSNLQKRLSFWENSISMIAEHPVTGVGAGNWRLVFPKYGLAGVDDSVMQGITHIQRPHNDYLWIWSEAGPAALLAFLALFFFAFRQISKNLKSSQDESDLKLQYLSFFGLLSFAFFSFSDFPLERASHTFLLMLFMAIPFAFGDVKQLKSVKFLPYILRLAILGSFYVNTQRFASEKATLAVLEANRDRNAKAIIPATEEAISNWYTVDAFANPLNYYSAKGYALTKRPKLALSELELATEAAPNNILVYEFYGQVYFQLGQREKALSYVDSALSISPKFKQALLLKAQLHLQAKEFANALGALNLYPPRSNDQRYLSSLAEALRGTLQGYAQHGRYSAMMEHLKTKKNLLEPLDYIRAYREKRGIK
jgi:O-antigen ligase